MDIEAIRHRFPDVTRMPDEQLRREYLDTVRDCFGRNVFCNNARHYLSIVVRELHKRGIFTIPNIFGPIEVREWEGVKNLPLVF